MLSAHTWPIAANMMSFGSTDSSGRALVEAAPEVWADHLRQVKDAGFDHVDLSDTWASIGDLKEDRLPELVAVLSDVGLAVPAISTTRRSIIDPEHGRENLSTCHRIIDRAPSFGVGIVNIGFMTTLTQAQKGSLWFWLVQGHVDTIDTRDLAVRRVGELARHAREVGIRLSLEIYEDTHVGTPDAAIRFLTDVDDDAVGLNPDLGNLVRLHRPVEPIDEMFEKVLPYTNFWHVKNYLRDEDPASGIITTAPAPLLTGIINYRAAVRRALELGFSGPFVCEHYGGDSLGVAATNHRYLRGLLRGALSPAPQLPPFVQPPAPSVL